MDLKIGNFKVIHNTAIISPKAKIGTDVTIGPFSIIHNDVTIGDNTSIGSKVAMSTPNIREVSR